MSLEQNRVPWTWADMLSTYRYWGLVLAFVFVYAANQFASWGLFRYGEREFELTLSFVGALTSSAWVVGFLIGLLLAWIGARTNPWRVLVITTGLAAAGVIAWVGTGAHQLVMFESAIFLTRIANDLMLFLVIGLMATARDRLETFVVAFGLLWILSLPGTQLGTYAYSALEEHSATGFGWLMGLLLLLAFVSLLPINQKFFSVDPPVRIRALVPKQRDPLASALLSCFVPFYFVYWMYRIHGEEASLMESRKLLSPRAAAWITVVPIVNGLMIPVILSSLADHHNEIAAHAGRPRMQRPWGAFLWALLFAPVAVGLVQSKFNETAAAQAQSTTAPAGA